MATALSAAAVGDSWISVEATEALAKKCHRHRRHQLDAGAALRLGRKRLQSLELLLVG